MKIEEWFDPYNEGHLRAYIHLEKEGFWRKGFLPGDIEMTLGWYVLLLGKMADAWIKHRIKDALLGSKDENNQNQRA